MDEKGLVERWQLRQEQLAELLESCDATSCERKVDWTLGRVTWIEQGGEPVVTARMKALCSYAFEDETLMMAWANEGLDQGAVISPQADVPDLIEACSEEEAWLWAMRLGEESGAEYLYRVSSPGYLVFLGLWNVRPETVELPVEAGTPQAFVVELLDTLSEALRDRSKDASTLRRLFINQGESLNQNAQYLYSDRSDGGLLRRTGDTLIEIGNSFGQRRFGLLPPASLSDAEMENIQKRVHRLRANWLKV